MKWHSPFEDGVPFQGGDGGWEAVETQHHPLILADDDRPSVGGVEDHLALPLLEEGLDFVLRNGPLLVEDEDLVRQDSRVEVEPAAAAHIPPNGDVPRPDLPLDLPVG